MIFWHALPDNYPGSGANAQLAQAFILHGERYLQFTANSGLQVSEGAYAPVVPSGSISATVTAG
ncbi:hypothetical protein [Chitinimonas sp.]|uniref:hypothetical protein n=1 Tax=Chitinimonas sp. TaxID=1934313 RepID=UPI0035B0C235